MRLRRWRAQEESKRNWVSGEVIDMSSRLQGSGIGRGCSNVVRLTCATSSAVLLILGATQWAGFSGSVSGGKSCKGCLL